LKLITTARDLRRRRGRERQQLFVAEGIRTVEALLDSPIRVRGALTSGRLADTARGSALRERLRAACQTEELSDAEFNDVADTETPQGVVAIGEIPASTLDGLALAPVARILALDGVQDPGNVGSLIRTAAALGVARTLVLPGTVDPWNAKVVRSAVGAHFHHPPVHCTWEEYDSFRSKTGVTTWAADPAGDPVGGGPVPERLALVIGNEGSGLTAEARQRAARVVGIALAGTGVESLNAAVAAGILLFELQP
jgi:RNA methyltransferase, TrmH family